MKSTRKPGTVATADEIAAIADKGGDVSRFFTGTGRMIVPKQLAVQRVNVDFAVPMLGELDAAANELNISRQALIKTLVRQALDQHSVARSAAIASRRSETACGESPSGPKTSLKG